MSAAFRFGWARRVETIMQAEGSECGLACIAMILTYFGRPTSISDLKRTAISSSRGASLRGMLDIAGQLGLQFRPLRLELEDISRIKLPAVLHLDGNHFAVLEQHAARGYLVHDPAVGRRWLAPPEVARRFTGVALEPLGLDDISPSQPKDDGTFGVIRKLGRLKGFKTSFLSILIFSIVLEATVLVGPLLMQVVVDSVVLSRDYGVLFVVCAGYLFLTVFQAVSTAFRSWAIAVLSSSLGIGWASNTFRRLIKQPDRYFHNRSIGDLSSRFGGLNQIQTAISIEAVAAMLDGILAICTLAVLFFYNSPMAFAACCGVMMYLFVKCLSFRAMSDANIDLITQQARKDTLFIESVRSQATIRLNNMQSLQIARFTDAVASSQISALRLSSVQLLFAAISLVIASASKIVIIYLGAKLIIDDAFTAGMLIAFVSYSDQFSGRSSRLVDYVMNWRLLRVYTDRIRDVIDSPIEVSSHRTAMKAPVDLDIRLDGVAFSYGGNEAPVILNATMDVGPGESVAIVGRSGSGKSTLIRLLSGTIDPVRGQITFGGLTYGQLGRMRVRDLISFVTQEDEVLSASIEANVSIFDDDVDEQFMHDCCRIAGVHDDIMAMPMRYQTLIGSGGFVISSGQKQRILIARALYRRPRVLVFDEATSHLDLYNEEVIFGNLKRLGCTLIIVAHRPETIKYASRVFALEDGILRRLPGVPPTS